MHLLSNVLKQHTPYLYYFVLSPLFISPSSLCYSFFLSPNLSSLCFSFLFISYLPFTVSFFTLYICLVSLTFIHVFSSSLIPLAAERPNNKEKTLYSKVQSVSNKTAPVLSPWNPTNTCNRRERLQLHRPTLLSLLFFLFAVFVMGDRIKADGSVLHTVRVCYIAVRLANSELA